MKRFSLLQNDTHTLLKRKHVSCDPDTQREQQLVTDTGTLTGRSSCTRWSVTFCSPPAAHSSRVTVPPTAGAGWRTRAGLCPPSARAGPGPAAAPEAAPTARAAASRAFSAPLCWFSWDRLLVAAMLGLQVHRKLQDGSDHVHSFTAGPQ